MNKSLLVVVAAAVAAVGIWLGIQSRQTPETLEPVVETAPEAEMVEPEPEIVEPEPVEEEVAIEEEPSVEEMIDEVADEAAVEEAAVEAEAELSPEAAEEAAVAVEEALELEDLGLDLSLDAIRAQIDAAGLNMAERGVIEGLLQSAGENPELLQQVLERLREMSGN